MTGTTVAAFSCAAFLSMFAGLAWRHGRRDAGDDWAGSAALVTVAGVILTALGVLGERSETEPLAVLVVTLGGALLLVSGVATFVINALPAPRARRRRRP